MLNLISDLTYEVFHHFLAIIGALTLVFSVLKPLAQGASKAFGSYGGTRFGKVFWGAIWYNYNANPNLINATLNIITPDGLEVDTLVSDAQLGDVFQQPLVAWEVGLARGRTTPDCPLITFPPHLKPGRLNSFLNWLEERRYYRRLKKYKRTCRKNGTPASQTDPLRPIRHFYRPPEMYKPVYNSIISWVSERCTNDGAIKKSAGFPCQTFRFVVALTYEQLENEREEHFRIMVISEEALKNLPAACPQVAFPEYATRFRTITQLAALYQHHPEWFGIMNWYIPNKDMPLFMRPKKPAIEPKNGGP